MRTIHAHHVRHSKDAGNPDALARMVPVRAWIDHHEAAAAGIVLAHQRQACRGLIVPFNDHVLQEVPQAGFDRPLVAPVHLEVVGDRTLLADAAVGVDENHARRITEFGAAGGELFE